MPLLVIDTALDACTVAVRAGAGKALVIRSEIMGRGHAERLFALLTEALADAQISARDLDRIGVTVGPGSFTGVRIGVAAARALAMVNGIQAVGVSTLAAHHAVAAALLTGGGARILALIPGRGDLYGQLYAADGSDLGPPRADTAIAFAREAVASGAVLAGSGADSVAAQMPAGSAKIVHRKAAPDPEALVALVGGAAATGHAPRPLYLRAADATPAAPAIARADA